MSGVDTFDQHIAAYRVLRKTNKYWKTIAFDILDVAVVNSYILFTQYRSAHPGAISRSKSYNAHEFRRQLICQLANIADDAPVPHYRQGKKPKSVPPQLIQGLHLPRHAEKEKYCRYCYMTEKTRRSCQSYCSTCKEYLHTNHRECFYLFHQREIEKENHIQFVDCLCSVRKIYLVYCVTSLSGLNILVHLAWVCSFNSVVFLLYVISCSSFGQDIFTWDHNENSCFGFPWYPAFRIIPLVCLQSFIASEMWWIFCQPVKKTIFCKLYGMISVKSSTSPPSRICWNERWLNRQKMLDTNVMMQWL